MWGMQIEVSSGDGDHGKRENGKMVPWKIRGMWQAMENAIQVRLNTPSDSF